MGKGNSSNFKTWWDRGFSVPRAFKLDHLQPVKPILLTKFSNFFTFILEANSYYPRERKAENGKMEFSQPEYGTGVWMPEAFKLDHLQTVESILFRKFTNVSFFIVEDQLLLPKTREEGWKWENETPLNWVRLNEFQQLFQHFPFYRAGLCGF